MGMDSSDRPLVSPAKLHQAVKALDANGRLDVILGKQNAAIVRDLNDTVRYVATVPPGTLVNSSGTAGTLLAAMAEAGATGALTGLPLPIASGIRQIIKMRQEGRTKAKINDALNALPIAPP
jgi:dihydrodipicolinate synthase/N-acetylneuraminate lyase